MTREIRVAIIEDHDDFREGLSHLLQSTEGFRCAGKYESLEEALSKIPASDVILLDINLPGKSGLEGISLLRKKQPQAQIIMLTVAEDEGTIFKAITNGADGYLLKKTPPVRLLQSIEEAANGGMPMSPLVARQAMTMLKRSVPQAGEDISLTPRELELLALLTRGMNYEMIGKQLFISIDTVRNHIRNTYEKLHVHSKAEAVAKAIRHGMIAP